MTEQSNELLNADEFALSFRAKVIENITKSLAPEDRESFRAWADAGCPDDGMWRPLFDAIGPVPVMAQADFERMR